MILTGVICLGVLALFTSMCHHMAVPKSSFGALFGWWLLGFTVAAFVIPIVIGGIGSLWNIFEKGSIRKEILKREAGLKSAGIPLKPLS